MKFIVSCAPFLKQLQLAARVIASNNALPILDNFLFEIKGDLLYISASDLETTLVTQVVVSNAVEGRVAVPAKLLIEAIKSLPDQPLSFSIDAAYSIAISSQYGNYKIAGLDASDFPIFPVYKDTTTFNLDSAILLRALQKTIFATANDEMRPVMTSINCKVQADAIIFAATDAQKMVKFHYAKSQPVNEPLEINLPKKPMLLLHQNLLVGRDEPVEVQCNQNNALFILEGVRLSCRLVDGKYPNYESVIPQNNPNKLVIERSSLLGSILRVSVFSNKTTHQIRLKLDQGHITVSAEDLEYATQATEKLTCEYQGEPMEIGFGAKHLAEMVKNIDTEDVVLEMSHPARAALVLPGESQENEQITMLLMPMVLNVASPV
jgi:DNA polymerase-3 subunit beta